VGRLLPSISVKTWSWICWSLFISSFSIPKRKVSSITLIKCDIYTIIYCQKRKNISANIVVTGQICFINEGSVIFFTWINNHTFIIKFWYNRNLINTNSEENLKQQSWTLVLPTLVVLSWGYNLIKWMISIGSWFWSFRKNIRMFASNSPHPDSVIW